jgi:hypothetical protein
VSDRCFMRTLTQSACVAQAPGTVTATAFCNSTSDPI